MAAYLYGLPPQYKETLCPLGEEPCELMYEDVFYLIGLLYSDADSH